MNVLFAAFGPDIGAIDPSAALRSAVIPHTHVVRERRATCAHVAASGHPLAGSPGLAVDEAMGWTLLFDGRLDDRAALLTELDADASCTDAALMMAALRRFGRAAPSRVIGDFALVLIDERRRELFAARDVFGTRPLFWTEVAGGLWLSSDFAPLFVRGGRSPRPDRRSVAELISYQFVEGERTLYEGVHALPGGTMLTTSLGARPRIVRYYEPGQGAHRYRAGLRDVESTLLAALEDRTSREAAVGVQLSGGLDSSVLTAMLARARTKAQLAPPTLQHLKTSGLSCDELVHAERVAAHVGLPLETVEGRRPYSVSDDSPVEIPDVWATTFSDLYKSAASRGIRTVVTGEGSDELQQSLGREVDDAVLRGSPREAVRRAGSLLSPAARERLVRGTLRAFFPRDLLHARWRGAHRQNLPGWLAPFGRRAAIEAFDRSERLCRSVDTDSLDRAQRVELLVASPAMTFFFAEQQRLARAFDVDLVHPFLDRRVADAVLALPCEVRSGVDPNKPGLRAIAAGWLPQEIAYRPLKVDYTDFQIGAWRDRMGEWLDLLRSSHRLADLGVVDGAAFRALGDAGFDPSALVLELRVALKLERWLRRFDARRAR